MILLNKPAYKSEVLKLDPLKPRGFTPEILSSFTKDKGTRTAKEAFVVVEGGSARVSFAEGGSHLLPPGFSFLLCGAGNLKTFSALSVSKSPLASLSITYFE